MKATFYERRTYEGRVIDTDRQPGSCGAPPLSERVAQMRDPKSWVRSSKELWLRIAMEEGSGREMSAKDLGL